MGIEALLSTQIIDTTTVGRAVMTAADAAAARTAIDSAATSHTHAASDITSGTIATARLASGTANSTTYLRGDQTWQTIAAGVGGSTGAVDNAVLRADGTGGSLVQASDWLIADNYTASPNNTVNHASIQATGSTTNVSVSLVPKGTGALSLHVPDGTATGGNARGANSVDLQTVRTAAGQVASGASSTVLGSRRATASGQSSLVFGEDATASGANSVAVGNYCRASNFASIAVGINSNASGNQAIAIGAGNGSLASGQNAIAIGADALANRERIFAYATGSFSNSEGSGDAQFVRWVLRNKTTDGTTAITLFANGSNARCLLTSGKVLHATVQIVGSKSDGSAVAIYLRQIAIKNVGGTTSLVGTVNTIGTDTAAGTSIAITADDTNDALQVAVTGVASETWRWVAVIEGVELAYGT